MISNLKKIIMIIISLLALVTLYNYANRERVYMEVKSPSGKENVRLVYKPISLFFGYYVYLTINNEQYAYEQDRYLLGDVDCISYITHKLKGLYWKGNNSVILEVTEMSILFTVRNAKEMTIW